MSDNPRKRRADEGRVPALAFDLPLRSASALTPAITANNSDEAHQRRVSRLEESAWERVGNGWQIDLSDPRWSKREVKVIDGDSFVENTRAAWGLLVRREAEEIRREALRPQR